MARKIRKIGDESPTPNQRIASGIQAIGEIGRRTWMSGLRKACAVPNQPISMPTGIAERGREQEAPRDAEERGHDVLEQEALAGQVDEAPPPPARGSGR